MEERTVDRPRLGWGTLREGLKSGLSVSWSLAKITFPTTLCVSVLKYTAVVGVLTRLITPFMDLFGLPGESVIAYVLGALLNIYAAIGAMLAIDLTVKQVFILAVMLSLAHNLIVETAVTAKVGVNPVWMTLCRLGLAFGFAFIFNLALPEDGVAARYGLAFAADAAAVPADWGAVWIEALKRAASGLAQMLLIIIPMMMSLQLLKDLGVMPALVRLLRPLTRVLGISENTSLMLVAGGLFGIAYGAGVIISSATENAVSRRDIYLVSLFLVCDHSLIEDTLIFLPLGINVLYLLLFRLALAVALTALTARFWRERSFVTATATANGTVPEIANANGTANATETEKVKTKIPVKGED
ncbi:MAG: hypothetical protein LBH21_03065 [Gracilibacteraceae bacterium]|jgi:spore maturation protein SpmB|nr:hypothetical protein [Gracilibacteraceae bacterium]